MRTARHLVVSVAVGSFPLATNEATAGSIPDRGWVAFPHLCRDDDHRPYRCPVWREEHSGRLGRTAATMPSPTTKSLSRWVLRQTSNPKKRTAARPLRSVRPAWHATVTSVYMCTRSPAGRSRRIQGRTIRTTSIPPPEEKPSAVFDHGWTAGVMWLNTHTQRPSRFTNTSVVHLSASNCLPA